MKNFRMYLLAICIEWKWWRIARNRQRIAALLERREPYISERLVALDESIADLGFSAKGLEKIYQSMMQAS